MPNPTAGVWLLNQTYNNLVDDVADGNQSVKWVRNTINQTSITTSEVYKNYGWYACGETPSARSSLVDRIDFSNDLAATSARGDAAVSYGQVTGASNKSYGWIMGGEFFPGYRTGVSRLDYASDLSGGSPRTNMTVAKGGAGGLSSNTYLYSTAGNTTPTGDPTGQLSSIERIDASNDTTHSAVGNLSVARHYLGAVGNASYGWAVGGGQGPGNIDLLSIERIDYSNDSNTATSRASLSLKRSYTRGASNKNYAWIVAGYDRSAGKLLKMVDKLTFANDLSSCRARGDLETARSSHSVTGNEAYGWVAFGGNTSNTCRIDYANDLATAVVKGQAPSARLRDADSFTHVNLDT